jgi:hypothetical protein
MQTSNWSARNVDHCEPKNHHGVAIGHKDQDHIRNEEGKKGNKERMKNKGKNKKKSPGRMHF